MFSLVDRDHFNFPLFSFTVCPEMQLIRRMLKFECIPVSQIVNGLLVTPRGVTPLFELYRYVQPQRVGFFSRFGHKSGIDFGHFGHK